MIEDHNKKVASTDHVWCQHWRLAVLFELDLDG